MLMSDKWIASQCTGERPMLSPYVPHSVSEVNGKPVCSFGSSSYGYDLTLGNAFKRLAECSGEHAGKHIDPNNFDQSLFFDVHGADADTMVLPPGGFVLGVTKERIIMPADVAGVCMQKSTIARSAIEVVVTPLEPSWEGYLTLEIHNKTTFPVHLTPGMGICQLLFFQGNEPCAVPYSARSGKYQDQGPGPVPPRAQQRGASGAYYLPVTSPLPAELQAPEAITPLQAIQALSAAVGSDKDYAWSWFCHIAMTIRDAGASDERANQGAANFMFALFGYKVWESSPEYAAHAKAASTPGVDHAPVQDKPGQLATARTDQVLEDFYKMAELIEQSLKAERAQERPQAAAPSARHSPSVHGHD